MRKLFGDDAVLDVSRLYLGHSAQWTPDAGWVQLEGVTNAGLMHLKGVTQLKELYVTSLKVTDTGLVQLKGLKQLASLDLHSTQVTDEGVQELQAALPNCRILR